MAIRNIREGRPLAGLTGRGGRARPRRLTSVLVLLLVLPALCAAQNEANLASVLERLSRLESENRALREEVRELTTEVRSLRTGASPPAVSSEIPQNEPTLEERVEIQERRVAEQAQTKVEASQRFPVRLTGMALFNAYYGSSYSGGQDRVLTAARTPGSRIGGATVRQSILGLEFQGPGTVWGGKVHGSIYAHFYDGLREEGYAPVRIRTGMIGIDWASRSISAGLEKPLFAPRDPTTLSQVGISPLTGAGNLWRWQPQIRAEQRLRLSPSTSLRAQVALLQTSEDYGGNYSPAFELERRRPGFEGRFELAHRMSDERRIEIAPGFHFSRTHAAGQTAPSDLVSLDWFANPWWKLQFSGAFFSGRNVAHFGAVRQGITLLPDYRLIAVRSRGGWGQVSFLATDRLSFNIYAGMHDDRDSDLLPGGIGRNQNGAVNLMYRLAPNVLFSIEALQVRTHYLGLGNRLHNRYDLALAYLF